MIQISPAQLRQIQYLIDQSIQGNHVLFDTETVRRALKVSRRERAQPETRAETDQHVETVLALPSISEKKAYLASLEPKALTQVIKSYFAIVENSISEHLEVKH